jgi:hypothetical protein
MTQPDGAPSEFEVSAARQGAIVLFVWIALAALAPRRKFAPLIHFLAATAWTALGFQALGTLG